MERRIFKLDNITIIITPNALSEFKKRCNGDMDSTLEWLAKRIVDYVQGGNRTKNDVMYYRNHENHRIVARLNEAGIRIIRAKSQRFNGRALGLYIESDRRVIVDTIIPRNDNTYDGLMLQWVEGFVKAQLT